MKFLNKVIPLAVAAAGLTLTFPAQAHDRSHRHHYDHDRYYSYHRYHDCAVVYDRPYYYDDDYYRPVYYRSSPSIVFELGRRRDSHWYHSYR